MWKRDCFNSGDASPENTEILIGECFHGLECKGGVGATFTGGVILTAWYNTRMATIDFFPWSHSIASAKCCCFSPASHHSCSSHCHACMAHWFAQAEFLFRLDFTLGAAHITCPGQKMGGVSDKQRKEKREIRTPLGFSVTVCHENPALRKLEFCVWNAWQGSHDPALPDASDSRRAESFLKDHPCCWLLIKHLQPGKDIVLLKCHYCRLSERESAQKFACFSQHAAVFWCHWEAGTAVNAYAQLLQREQASAQVECFLRHNIQQEEV